MSGYFRWAYGVATTYFPSYRVCVHSGKLKWGGISRNLAFPNRPWPGPRAQLPLVLVPAPPVRPIFAMSIFTGVSLEPAALPRSIWRMEESFRFVSGRSRPAWFGEAPSWRNVFFLHCTDLIPEYASNLIAQRRIGRKTGHVFLERRG